MVSRLGELQQFQQFQIATFRIDQTCEKSIERPKLDSVFPSGRLQKSRVPHIRELTRFQRERYPPGCAVHHRRVELTPGVPYRENVWSPRDLPVFRDLSFASPSCWDRSRNERTLFDRSFSRQISIGILEVRDFSPSTMKRHLRNHY